MKTKFLTTLTALFFFICISSSAIAFQVSVEDVSNQITTCDPDSPLLANLPIGSCLVIPPGTLHVDIELEENDDKSLLDNVHLVIHATDGTNYQYQTSYGGMLWQNIPRGVLENKLLLSTSLTRAPWETETKISRNIDLGVFALNKGAKIFVGLRANNVAGFVEGSIREIYEVTQDMVDPMVELYTSIYGENFLNSLNENNFLTSLYGEKFMTLLSE